MTTHPFLSFVYVLANLAIAGGFAYLAVGAFRRTKFWLPVTRVAAVGFFAFGGITCLDAAYNVLTDTTLSFDPSPTSWYVLAIRVSQAICGWLFMGGLHVAASLSGVDPAKRIRRPASDDSERP